MTILDGKKVSNEILEDLKIKFASLDKKAGFAIIWVGNNEASGIYVKNKLKKCEKLGIEGKLYHLEENTKEEEVLELIDKLNNDDSVNGILIQSPLPRHINEVNCFNHVNYKKDVDGFSNISAGNLTLGNPSLISCTPKGIMYLFDYYHLDLEGKNVCLINRSNIVGKPLFNLLIKKNATVTMCHSKTSNLEDFTKKADIVISAVGKPKFITSEMIKDGAIVIDVGISRENGKVIGDVDSEAFEKASYITPVPGGVGPMTIAMIFSNLYEAITKYQNK